MLEYSKTKAACKRLSIVGITFFYQTFKFFQHTLQNIILLQMFGS